MRKLAEVERFEYKGNPMIKLTADNGFTSIQFGLTKARMIIENIDDIKSFVKENE